MNEFEYADLGYELNDDQIYNESDYGFDIDRHLDERYTDECWRLA